MATQARPSPRLVFGPFEADIATGELRKNGIRVRLPPQSFQILLALLAQTGEVVTRKELLEKIWDDGTFVDFERGLNSAMAKLRRALGDSADSPRYIETVPGRGYRFMGTVEHQSGVGGHPATGTAEELPSKQPVRLAWWLASVAVCLLLLALGLVWRRHEAAPGLRPWKFTRLTSGSGLTATPTLSPDGKLVAYSSQQGPSRGRDLYIAHVGGGQPIRLTFDGTGNTAPDFSPDGSRLVFRSSRDGGGIYQMPALGGDIRLVARNGLNPKFSPDGSQVAYWSGAESVAAAIPGSGTVWVVPVVGGAPRRVGSGLTAARHPIWSRDGKYLLVVGYISTRAFDPSGIDWWLVGVDDRNEIQVGARKAMVQAGLTPQPSSRTPVPSIPAPSCWLEKSGAVVFSMPVGDARNIWQISISSTTGQAKGIPERLTTGSGKEFDPSCSSSSALAFANVETRNDVWVLPFDLNAATPKGAIGRITELSAFRNNVSLARDEHRVAFGLYESGRQNIRLREFDTGKETTVAESPFTQAFPVANASGSKIAFSVYEKDKRVVYMSSPGGAPEKLCEGCLRATDWSRDEKRLLVFGGDPYQINILEIASRKQFPLVSHPRQSVLYGRFSPDNCWVSFTARVAADRGRIAVAAVDGLKPIAENTWITIAEADADDYAHWSPDGKTLYFTSRRDGYSCLWAQRLDPDSRQPIGKPFAVQHLHGALSFAHGGWSAAGGRIAMSLVEQYGSIWTMWRTGSGGVAAAP